MLTEEICARLRAGQRLACEVSADDTEYRRFVFADSMPKEFQPSGAGPEAIKYGVGSVEIPIRILELEAQGEVIHQRDFQRQIPAGVVVGPEAAAKLLIETIGERQIIQPLQNDRDFEPPVLS